jgi:predicted HTH transcriptional regulator
MSLIIAVLAALYYGPKRMIEAWEWYRYRWFDSKVLRYMKEHTKAARRQNQSITRTAADVAGDLRISERAAETRLRRLQEKDLVEQHGQGWFLT